MGLVVMTPQDSYSRGRACSRKAFSLAELLVVMALMTLLAGMIAPAMNLAKSRNLNIAGNHVADLVQQARQNSMAKNVMTALVFVNNSANPDWNGRLVVLLELSGNTWKPVTRWMQLPAGVTVDFSESASFFASTPNIAPSPTLPPYERNTIAIAQCGYQIFAPGGRLLTTGITNPTSPLLRLVEGSNDGQQVVKQNSGNYYDIVINRFTGIPKIDRR